MNRLNCLLLIQALLATPALAAPLIPKAAQPQIATIPVTTGSLITPIKIAHQHQPQAGKITRSKTNKAYSSVAYYQRQAQRRKNLLRSQRMPHHSLHSGKPIQASQKHEAPPLTGFVHQEEALLQTSMLPPTMAPSLIPPETIKPKNQERPSPAEARYTTSQQQAGSKLGWLKQLTRQAGTTEFSWVSDITDAQSLQLARSISTYVTELLPNNSTFLLLAPPPKAQKNNLLTQILTETLQQAGFKLVDSKNQAKNVHVLLYQISQLDNGIWLKIKLNRRQANRFYAINAAENLAEDAPFTICEDN